MTLKPIEKLDVQMVFDSYPAPIRGKLMALREIIFEVATASSEIGMLEETLKWGQISYLTHDPKSGTTLRIDKYSPTSDQVAIFVHCQTTLVDTFRILYPSVFEYEGTRAVIFDRLDDGRLDALKHCIQLTLTYHLR